MILIPYTQKPSRCPHCHNIENIKEVCRSCGHEYEEDDLDPVELFIGAFALIFIAASFVGIMFWCMSFLTGNESMSHYVHESYFTAREFFARLFS